MTILSLNDQSLKWKKRLSRWLKFKMPSNFLFFYLILTLLCYLLLTTILLLCLKLYWCCLQMCLAYCDKKMCYSFHSTHESRCVRSSSFYEWWQRRAESYGLRNPIWNQINNWRISRSLIRIWRLETQRSKVQLRLFKVENIVYIGKV